MLQLAKNQVITNVAKSHMDIRQMELDWYTSNYDTINGQAAVIAGFAFSQLSAGAPAGAPVWLEVIYILLMSITLGFELNVSMSCTFCNIFGKSLALRGPDGSASMHFAIDSLQKEHKRIFAEFVLGIITYMVSHIFEIVMTFRPRIAFISTIPISLFTFATIYYTAILVRKLIVPEDRGVTGQVGALHGYELIQDLDSHVYEELETTTPLEPVGRVMRTGGF
eukprot:TRINITY_DN68332_c0_g1_i1.p1 TRINITY_DN68332_c0_g1~~TRINITY_DN68332_c0_g1_i1.p1  ORF type:complete len:223 (-),score=38.96 TRINITY_DN68332_c0_g1_i1:174-842(-)